MTKRLIPWPTYHPEQGDMTRPIATTGAPSRPASHGARGTSADSIPFPPDPYELSSSAFLKRSRFTQALIDVTALVFCLLFVFSVVLSVPLSLFLLIFAKF